MDLLVITIFAIGQHTFVYGQPNIPNLASAAPDILLFTAVPHGLHTRLCHAFLVVTSSAGLMPTEAHGNYLSEAPYLRETKMVRPI